MSEDDVRHYKNRMITDAHAAGLNIVIDDTNINPNTLEKTKKFLEALAYETEVFDCFDAVIKEWIDAPVALGQCITWNTKREKYVPESVIYDMYLQDDRLLDKKDVVIIDLDGTLYNIDHRLEFVTNGKRDWAQFESQEEIAKDQVYDAVKKVITSLYNKYSIILLSGRKNKNCKQTVANLERDGIKYDALLMRQTWDSKPDYQVKQGFVDLIKKNHNILFAFDDRKQVIDMWKKNGVYVFNCCQKESNDF